MSDLKHYIEQLKRTKDALSDKEEYEICAEVQQLIDAIESRDVKTFIDINFDKRGLIKIGFFKKKMSYPEMEERVKTFFDLDNIFEYAIADGMRCPYARYNAGVFDMIEDVKF